MAVSAPQTALLRVLSNLSLYSSLACNSYSVKFVGERNQTECARVLARNRWYTPPGQFSNELDYSRSCGLGVGNHKDFAVPRPEGKRVTGIQRQSYVKRAV